MSPGAWDRLHLIGATALVTSLGWIGVLALVLARGDPAKAPGSPLHMAVPAATGTAISTEPAQPRAEASVRLIVPVLGVRPDQLTDTFTQSRAGGARPHDAIDIMASRGTQVVAAAPGTVEKLFLSRDGGKTIYIRSLNGTLIYYYAHLDTYAPGLTEGQSVGTGDPLGQVGSTGNANPAAPHLHFAILRMAPGAHWWQTGEALNPYPLLTAP